ncbi:MAG: hypothetical protein R2724_25685 [Bryobacterales bacterium]
MRTLELSAYDAAGSCVNGVRLILGFALRLILLALLAAAAASPSGSTRKVWADASTNLLGGLSPDGKLLSYVERSSGDLGVYTLATGEKRLLTHNAENAPTFAYFSAFSRDSRNLAYAWFNDQGFYELWTIPLEGGAPRKLYSNPENGFVQPCDWSRDGKQILTLFFRKDNVSQIALVSAEDGSVRVLKTLSWFYPKKISFSPDGRYILYDSLTGRDEIARDILLLDADGSAEHKLIEHPANDIFPLWTPSGDGVVFASDRSGTMDLWLAPFQEGQITAEPRPIARSLGRALPIGIAPDGAYYFGLRAGRSDVQIAGLLGEQAVDPQTAGLRTLGRNHAPAWSRDGKRVAYLTQIGTENYGQESRGVAIWIPETRQETRLTPALASIARVSWSPDDTLLLASGADGRGRSGLFTVNPDTGETEGLVRIPGGPPEGLEGVWLGPRAAAYINGDRTKILPAAWDGEADRPPLYEAPAGAQLRLLAGADDVLAFALERDGKPSKVLLLTLPDGRARTVFETAAGAPQALELTAERLYVTAAEGQRAVVWSVGLTGGEPHKTQLPAGLHVSPDGKQVAYVASDQREEVWALEGWLEPEATTAPLESRR